MQRRAAAAYATLFVVLSIGAYTMIAVSAEPPISLDNPDHTLAPPDRVTIDGRTYTVSEVAVSDQASNATLTWIESNATYTRRIANNSTLTAPTVRWPGQSGRSSAQLANDTTMLSDGTTYEVTIENGTVTLSGPDETRILRWGDELRFRGNATELTRITASTATVAWGDPYRVLIPNRTAPREVRLRQQVNVTARLRADPHVDNRTVIREDGRRYVVYATNGTTQLLGDYLPAPDTETFAEGDQFGYRANDTRIANVSRDAITLRWNAPRAHTIVVEEGANVTLHGRTFVVHFPDEGTVELSSDLAGYQEEVRIRDRYHERVNGLWGVVILGTIATIVILIGSYLPSRY